MQIPFKLPLWLFPSICIALERNSASAELILYILQAVKKLFLRFLSE